MVFVRARLFKDLFFFFDIGFKNGCQRKKKLIDIGFRFGFSKDLVSYVWTVFSAILEFKLLLSINFGDKYNWQFIKIIEQNN